MIECLQLLLLIILVDRNLILRNRYKIRFEYKPYHFNKYGGATAYFGIWLFCKAPNDDVYTRNGGKRLFSFGGRLLNHRGEKY